MTRRRLPDRRDGPRLKLSIGGKVFYLGYGFYEDGTLGEIWIDVDKAGEAALRHWAHASAVLFSVALQYGAPLESLVKMFLGLCSEPNGQVTGHPSVTQATSILDCVAQILKVEFIDGTGRLLRSGDTRDKEAR